MTNIPEAEDFLHIEIEKKMNMDEPVSDQEQFWRFFWMVYDPNVGRKKIIEAMKEYGRQVRDVTLDWAAEHANLRGVNIHQPDRADDIADSVYSPDPNGPDYSYTVNKESIYNGKTSANLEI